MNKLVIDFIQKSPIRNYYHIKLIIYYFEKTDYHFTFLNFPD